MAKGHKFKDGLTVVKLTTQKIPEFREVKGKDWVSYGRDNLYPDYLISLFERSSTNNAILTGKVNYVLGEGWRANKNGLSTTSEAKINDFINNINEDETLNELTEKIDLDFEIFDGFYLKVVRTKNKKDYTLHHMPFNKMRTNEDESEFYYSMDWKPKQQSKEKTGYKEYPKFDGTLKHSESIYYFRILSPRKGSDANIYPLPNYIGGTQAIETEIECQNYNLAEIKTGFSAGTLINFPNGIPTEDEKDDIEDKIREKYTGTDAAGRIIINFSDGKDKAAEVVSLSGNDLSDRYLNVKKDSRNSILTSHKVTSGELFGIAEEGNALNGRTQIAEKDELFQNAYVSKRQRILEGVFNGFAGLKGVPDRLMIKPTSAINTDVFSEAVIVANLPAPAITDLIAERMGIDLSKYENKGVTTQMASQHYEDNLLTEFGKVGYSKDLFTIVKSKDFKFNTDIEAEESEYQFAEDEGEDLDPILPPEFPKKREDKPKKAPKSGRIMVLYSYEWRTGFSNSDLKTSRGFCKELIRQDKLYTRAEINRLSNEFNTDVWKYKGGWYTNPRTDVPRPQCRHIWRQNVVKVK